MLHNDFKITSRSKLDFLADTEYYPSLKYHTKEFVIRLWLSALAMTVKYTTDLASSEIVLLVRNNERGICKKIPRIKQQPLYITLLTSVMCYGEN